MADMDKPISMAGTRTFVCDFKKALTTNPAPTFTELELLDVMEKGDIENQVDTYRPFNNTKVYKYMSSQDYATVILKGAKVPASSSRSAFETSAARNMTDWTKSRTYKDLIKCVPVGTGTYECTIYSGFFKKANLDDVEQKKISYGIWEFEVTEYKEASGSISGSTLTLTARS